MASELSRRGQQAVAASVAFVVAAAGVAALLVIKGWTANANASEATSQSSGPQKQLPQGPAPATKDFPRSASGLTYGSDALAESTDDAPDLIATVGDAGVSGYVRKADLYGPDFKTPEEALAWQTKISKTRADVIPVFDLNGKQVDVFTLMVGSGTTDPDSVSK
ncbi:MAG: hypothetical protein QM655_08855 [Nocardioidaceae bacterium]